MNNFLLILVIFQAIIILILLLAILIKFKEKMDIKQYRARDWQFENNDSDRFIITNVNMQKINNWRDPQIQLWLLNPAGIGIRVDDKKLPLNGRVKNPPKNGSVKIYVLLSETEIWYQGEYPLNEKGEWNGWIYLAVGKEEEYKKVIRLELYTNDNGNKEKIDTYDIIIE